MKRGFLSKLSVAGLLALGYAGAHAGPVSNRARNSNPKLTAPRSAAEVGDACGAHDDQNVQLTTIWDNPDAAPASATPDQVVLADSAGYQLEAVTNDAGETVPGHRILSRGACDQANPRLDNSDFPGCPVRAFDQDG